MKKRKNKIIDNIHIEIGLIEKLWIVILLINFEGNWSIKCKMIAFYPQINGIISGIERYD